MPILLVASALDESARERATPAHGPRYGNGALSDFGLLGEQSSPKCYIPCLEGRWTACAKFDAASFILGKEIPNPTNTHSQGRIQGGEVVALQ